MIDYLNYRYGYGCL